MDESLRLPSALNPPAGETRLRSPDDTRRTVGEGEEKTSSLTTGMVLGLGTGLSLTRLLEDRPPEGTRLNGECETKPRLARPLKPMLALGGRGEALESGDSFSLLPDTLRSLPPEDFLSVPPTEGKATLPFSLETLRVPLTAGRAVLPLAERLLLRGLAEIPSPIAALGVAATPEAVGGACPSGLAVRRSCIIASLSGSSLPRD